jgi:hypothetical protein
MQTIQSLAPIREIIAQSMSRYATITSKGILLPSSSAVYNPLPVTIITYGPARTRYINRKPICRSLNGISSLERKQTCALCQEARTCTPQIALDICYRIVPVRLLLAFTSAKNFMALLRKLGIERKPYEGAHISISVIDRGRWGEACFEIV